MFDRDELDGKGNPKQRVVIHDRTRNSKPITLGTRIAASTCAVIIVAIILHFAKHH